MHGSSRVKVVGVRIVSMEKVMVMVVVITLCLMGAVTGVNPSGRFV